MLSRTKPFLCLHSFASYPGFCNFLCAFGFVWDLEFVWDLGFGFWDFNNCLQQGTPSGNTRAVAEDFQCPPRTFAEMRKGGHPNTARIRFGVFKQHEISRATAVG